MLFKAECLRKMKMKIKKKRIKITRRKKKWTNSILLLMHCLENRIKEITIHLDQLVSWRKDWKLTKMT